MANDKIEKQAPAVFSVRPSSWTRVVMVRSVVAVVLGTLLCYCKMVGSRRTL